MWDTWTNSWSMSTASLITNSRRWGEQEGTSVFSMDAKVLLLDQCDIAVILPWYYCGITVVLLLWHLGLALLAEWRCYEQVDCTTDECLRPAVRHWNEVKVLRADGMYDQEGYNQLSDPIQSTNRLNVLTTTVTARRITISRLFRSLTLPFYDSSV